MNRITWLMENFGLTYRQLGEMLRVSPGLLHLFHHRKRNLPPRSETLLEHSLFHPYPVREEMGELPPLEDPDKDMRIFEMGVRFNRLQVEWDSLRRKKRSFDHRYRQLHTVLFHTRNLEETPPEKSSLIPKWWRILQISSLQELESFTVTGFNKMQLRQTLILAELDWLEKELAKEGKAIHRVVPREGVVNG